MRTLTLREKISVIREKLEPYRFRYLRILRTVIFYWLLMNGVQASLLLPEEMTVENPFFAHGMASLSMLVLFVMLSGVFVLYDPTARRRFCKAPPKETGIFSETLFVLRSYEFIVEAVCLVFLPLLLRTDAYAYPIYFFFGREDFGFWDTYFLFLLTVLPIFLLIEVFMRVRTRHFWRTLSYEEAKDKHLDALALIFLSAVIRIGGPLISGIYLVTVAMLIGFLWKYGIFVLLAIACVLAVYLLLIYARAYRIRQKFLKRLKRTCCTENITISKIERPYRSLFTQKRADYQFTVELHGKTYACKLIGAMAKNMPMLFCDKETGYFKYGYRFRGKDIVFWREWFTHSFDAPNADKKIIIVIPAPRQMRAIWMHTLFATDNVTFISEGKGERPLDNASVVYDAIVFSGSGFINALKRDCLDKSADF